ncbi:peptide ABC transporter substrate-binding protein [Campylobacter sp. MIT 99-7217]|uniref:ABC transporter ATP-binding protein n=1 Tax=Campylobacter sp. MIT 99-7217 TaxID=535091 RepID=UPI00115A332C|nr:ABC transporter ATP-binding protein [Campylobacter sp. MIT 99-7217]TQR30972.1 peptide ABC transporter substrate-binding protein [Campylobacter sp. MIT 99-7217]
MLRLQNLSIHRGNLCVADEINAEFKEGKIYAVLGPNGAGKSSLLSAIFGDLHFKGKISFEDMELSLKNHYLWKKDFGFMPQDSGVDASLSALEVVLLGLMDSLGMYISDEQIQKALSLMQNLGILHLAHQDVMSLSGGQRQMVMFASVLIKTPKVLLLDEPVSALDLHHQCVLLECVKEHTKKEKLISIVILHDLSLAAQFADELLILEGAKIHAFGKAKDALSKDLIEKLYRIKSLIFYDDEKPVIVAKKALRN